MLEIDEAFLYEVGLGEMPDHQKTSFLEYLRETLEMHVGSRLVQSIDQALLDEFEELINLRDEVNALQWLELNCPGYHEVVIEETNKLKDELIVNRHKILSSSF